MTTLFQVRTCPRCKNAYAIGLIPDRSGDVFFRPHFVRNNHTPCRSTHAFTMLSLDSDLDPLATNDPKDDQPDSIPADPKDQAQELVDILIKEGKAAAGKLVGEVGKWWMKNL
jgi:hypothetical protein